MKWTNPGHQLDELGKRYLKVKNLYIVGVDEDAAKVFSFLKWLGISEEFNICFVNDIAYPLLRFTKRLIVNRKGSFKSLLSLLKKKNTFCGKDVITFSILRKRLRESGNQDNSVITLNSLRQSRKADKLKKLGVENIFYLVHSHNRRENFIQNFVCIWLMYKHDKLLSHWTNYITTLRCNLNCEGCLNFNKFIVNPVDVAFDDFKKHVDTLFSKFDYAYSFHLCGGEPMLVKELPKFIRYLAENYKEKIFEFFIITNSTIIPSDDVISAVKLLDGYFLLDDYSENAPNNKLVEIQKKLDKHDIKYITSKPSFWFDVDIMGADNTALSSEELGNYKDDCQSFLHEFAEGRIFSCCYQKYAQRAGLVEITSDDYIEISNSTKMEILEFRQGYTVNGYVDLCKHCRGIGSNAIKISPAVQVPRTNNAKRV